MGDNGGNNKPARPANNPSRETAIANLSSELDDCKLPPVLSSYMKGENLPEEYQGIDPYIHGIRKRMIDDAGGELTQLQMVMLDGICEVLLVIKFISTFIGENPETQIITYDRLGTPKISDIVLRGFGNFHTILDKKIKQFNDMTEDQKNALSPQEVHRRAVMGETMPVGRPLANKDRRLKENRDREIKEMGDANAEEDTEE